MERPRVLILRHEEATPPGLITPWLESLSMEAEELRIDLEDREIDPSSYQLLVSLGSEHAAYDDSLALVQRGKRLFTRAIECDVPVLGLCFGGQLVARVLGAEVFRAKEAEIGWLPVRSLDPEFVGSGPWLQWHSDTFSLPPQARLLADSTVGPQVFSQGRSLGVQFHPEVTPEIIEVWVRVYRHELDAEGVDPDQLLVETKQLAAEVQATARRLLDHFVQDALRMGVVHGGR